MKTLEFKYKKVSLLWLSLIIISVLSSGCSTAYMPQEPVKESLQTNTQETVPHVTQRPTTLPQTTKKNQDSNSSKYDVVIEFPTEKYPETAKHIQDAIENGESSVCTIDRSGADENRDKSLDGIPTKKGYDRDEWPMAMCVEGGSGADIAYVTPSDNRGAGSWVGHQLSDYEDGTRILFVVDGEKRGGVKDSLMPTPTTEEKSFSQVTSTDSNEKSTEIYYKNCTAVKEAGAAPIRAGEMGYSKKLDRDGDGIACE